MMMTVFAIYGALFFASGFFCGWISTRKKG